MTGAWRRRSRSVPKIDERDARNPLHDGADEDVLHLEPPVGEAGLVKRSERLEDPAQDADRFVDVRGPSTAEPDAQRLRVGAEVAHPVHAVRLGRLDPLGQPFVQDVRRETRRREEPLHRAPVSVASGRRTLRMRSSSPRLAA